MDAREEWLMKELERVEGKIETREKERRTTVDTKLIDDIKQEITRLVDEERDLLQQLTSQQAGPADAPRVSTEQRAAALPNIPEHSRYEQLCAKLDALIMQQDIMIMQQEIMSSKQDQLMIGTQMASVLARRILRWTASHGSSADQRPDNAPFKRRLVQHYYPSHTEEQCTYKCMVTGRELESALCIAGHIIGCGMCDIAKVLLGIEDIHSIRNGILWAKCIENAYEDSRFCMIHTPLVSSEPGFASSGGFMLHVLDERIMELRLSAPLPGLKKAGEELDNERIALCNLTWSDLNGKPIYYKFTSDTLPYKRGFALHAERAYAVALERKVVPDTFDPGLLEHDIWSNTAVKKKVMDWNASLEVPLPPDASSGDVSDSTPEASNTS